MQKLPEVRDPEPEKQDSGTSSEPYSDDLIAQFKIRLKQLLRGSRTRNRPTRKQNNKSNGVGSSD